MLIIGDSTIRDLRETDEITINSYNGKLSYSLFTAVFILQLRNFIMILNLLL